MSDYYVAVAAAQNLDVDELGQLVDYLAALLEDRKAEAAAESEGA